MEGPKIPNWIDAFVLTVIAAIVTVCQCLTLALNAAKGQDLHWGIIGLIALAILLVIGIATTITQYKAQK